MNTNSAFTGSFTENPFWYQQFDLRQIRMLRMGQPIVDFDTADNCRLYVTTMKAKNFQDVISSILIDDFKHHYVLVFDLTSMQDATENCYYPELVGEPLTLELKFTNPLENVTELIVLGVRKSSVAVWCCWKECVKMDNFALQQIINRIPLLKFRYLGSFPSDFVQLSIITLLLLSTRSPAICRVNIGSRLQVSDMNCFLQTLLDVKGSFFNNQHYKQTMPARLQSHPNVCCFYTKYAAFHPFKFRQEEVTGVHDVNVLSFISNYM